MKPEFTPSSTPPPESAVVAYSYVRLSTKKQMKGHGSTRQQEATLAAALQHGWQLSEQTFEDLGVSAWKGTNIETGALSQFLRCVEDGLITSGSVLIVENVDRLSRAGVNTAVGLMMQLLNHGISIYTLTDRKLYQPNAENPLMDLMYWAMSAQRGHEESAVKSQRILAAKAKRKEEARESGKIITKLCPAWLKVKDDRSGFELIPERVDTVKRIFELYLQGYGAPRIGRVLTEEGRPPLRGQAWYVSSVSRVLQYRAVLGEFQPLKGNGYVDNNPDGEPILNYYPQIISEDDFNEAQAIRAEGGAGKGRRSSTFKNVFSHLLRCKCGNGININNSVQKGRRYFQARCIQYKINCQEPMWNFVKFQTVVLFALRRLPLLELMKPQDVDSVTEYRREVRRTQKRLGELNKQISNITQAIASIGLNDDLQRTLEVLSSERREQLDHLDKTEKTLEHAQGQQVIGRQDEELLSRFNELMDNLKEEDERIKLNQVLRRYLSRITLERLNEDTGERQITIWSQEGKQVARILMDKLQREATIEVDGQSDTLVLTRMKSGVEEPKT